MGCRKYTIYSHVCELFQCIHIIVLQEPRYRLHFCKLENVERSDVMDADSDPTHGVSCLSRTKHVVTTDRQKWPANPKVMTDHNMMHGIGIV